MNELKIMIESNQKYLVVLMVFIVLDMLTGVIHAILKKELKSSVFREGLLKKVLEMIVVILAFSLAWCSGISELSVGTVAALVLMESYSILENIAEYIPIPVVLKNFIDSAKESK